MRLNEHVGEGDFAHEIGPLPTVAQIDMLPDVVPRPTVEPAFLDTRDEVGRQVVADQVSFVTALRIVDEHVGAVGS